MIDMIVTILPCVAVALIGVALYLIIGVVIGVIDE